MQDTFRNMKLKHFKAQKAHFVEVHHFLNPKMNDYSHLMFLWEVQLVMNKTKNATKLLYHEVVPETARISKDILSAHF